MKEIEIKFKVNNFEDITARLKKQGAKCDWRGIEESFFFDTPDRRLKRKRQMLRLRRWEGHSNSLTLKLEPESSKRFKIRDEYQIMFDDMDTARDILKHLGYAEYLRYKKYREHWVLKDAVVELDKLKSLYFVEIEASQDRIQELVSELGLDWKKTTTEGYLTILKNLERRHART